MRTTTVKELGQRLPIGALVDGKLVKDFSLRPFKARVSRALNLYREANKGKSVAWLAAKYVSIITERVGGESFALTADGDSTPEQELRVHGMPWADVMYIYIYSRIASCGEWMEIPAACQAAKCEFSGAVRADLLTIEVTVIDDPAELHTWVTLKDGLRAGGATCRRLRLQPVPFRATLLPGTGAADLNVMSYAQLRESIVEAEGAPDGYVLRDEDLDDVSHMDLLRIDRQAGERAAGCDLRTKVACPKCGATLLGTMNWGFDYFFDSSVPSSTLTG